LQHFEKLTLQLVHVLHRYVFENLAIINVPHCLIIPYLKHWMHYRLFRKIYKDKHVEIFLPY
jgi:hypothetical protein